MNERREKMSFIGLASEKNTRQIHERTPRVKELCVAASFHE
jgi:hypothetical protein